MAEKKNEYGLTLKQQKFCDLYRASDDPELRGNAKHCYMAAYGANEKSAEHNGPRLLKNPSVEAYLNSKRDKAMRAADITQERILEEVACMAFLDPAAFYDDYGNLVPVHNMPEHARRALTGLESFEEYEGTGKDRVATGMTRKIKYADKKGSLELLMKHLGMLKTEIELPKGMGGVMLFPSDVSADEWRQQHYGKPDQKGS